MWYNSQTTNHFNATQRNVIQLFLPNTFSIHANYSINNANQQEHVLHKDIFNMAKRCRFAKFSEEEINEK